MQSFKHCPRFVGGYFKNNGRSEIGRYLNFSVVYKTFELILYLVRSATFVGTHAIGLGIPDEAFLLRIECNFASQLPADRSREAGHVAVTNCSRIANRLFPSLNAIKEVTGVQYRIRTRDLVVCFVFKELGIAGYYFLGIPRFHPAFIAHKAHGASTQSFDPIALPLETGKAHYQLDAIGILRVDQSIRYGFKFDGRRSIGIGSPLADVNRMGPPLGQLPCSIETLVIAPATSAVRSVKR